MCRRCRRVGGQGQVAGAGVAVFGLFGHAAGDHRVKGFGDANGRRRQRQDRRPRWELIGTATWDVAGLLAQPDHSHPYGHYTTDVHLSAAAAGPFGPHNGRRRQRQDRRPRWELIGTATWDVAGLLAQPDQPVRRRRVRAAGAAGAGADVQPGGGSRRTPGPAAASTRSAASAVASSRTPRSVTARRRPVRRRRVRAAGAAGAGADVQPGGGSRRTPGPAAHRRRRRCRVADQPAMTAITAGPPACRGELAVAPAIGAVTARRL